MNSKRLWGKHGRRLRFVQLALLFLLLGAACSRPTMPRPSLPRWLGGQQALPTPTPPAISTQLQLWSWTNSDAETDYLQQLVNDHEMRYPAVDVELVRPDNYTRRLRTALGTDKPPDVFLLNLHELPDLIQADAVAPLPATLVDATDLYPHLQRAIQFENTFYCAPRSFYTLALFYNHDLFRTAAVAEPTLTWGWAEVQAAATALTVPEINVYGLVLAADVSRWAAFLGQAGGAVTTANDVAMAVNSPAALVALETYTNLVLEGVAASPTTLGSRWPGEAFAAGRAAMMIEGNWAIPYLAEQNPQLAYGVTELPAGPAGKATLSFGTCFGIAAAAPDRVAAARLITDLTSAESQRGWFAVSNAIAPRPSLAPQWRAMHPTLQPFVASVNFAEEWQLPANFAPWVTAMNRGIGQIFGGFIPADALLPTAEELGNQLLATDPTAPE